MSYLRALQTERNGASRNRRHEFAVHRQAVMRCLSDAPGGRLLLLGAGNCNDIEPAALARIFDEVHFCDVDSQAMQHAVDAVPADLAQRFKLHHLDISGMEDALTSFDRHSDEPIDGLIQQASNVEVELPGTFDVVGSMCLLTQLIEQPLLALGEQHAQLLPLVLAVRDAHLQRLVQLVRPGGSGWLITDVVSETTVPELASDEACGDLSVLLTNLLRSQNFFTGVNPLILRRKLQDFGASDVAILEPWRWNQGRRHFLVCGLRFQKDKSPSAGTAQGGNRN